MNLPKNIRLAKLSDAEAMLEIYKPYILDSYTSFEVELPAIEEFRSRIEETLKKFAWLVYEDSGEVVGYAYASPHRSRCAYGWSVECSVYVGESHQRRGIGRALYQALFAILKAQGAVNVLAGITLPNPGSIRIHESLGFVQVATYKDVGFKMGKWWDVGWWQLQLQKPAQPGEVKPLPQLYATLGL